VTPTIGLAGCGRWGANILRDLRSLGAAVIVADPRGDRRSAALESGALAAVPGPDDLPHCDGYVVATPATTHRHVSEVLLRRHAPVFVEKPPCASITEVERLVHLGKDRLFVMHKWRYHPGIGAIRDLLAQGDLGDAVVLTTIRTGPEPLPIGVDVTWHLAVHDLAIALEVWGSVPRIVRAEGTVDSEGRIVRCEAIMQFGGGARHRLVAAAACPDRTRRVELIGTVRTAVLPFAESRTVDVYSTGAGRVEVPLSDAMPLELELRAFLDHVMGGPPPKSSATDALEICGALAEIDARVRAD
jgi:predicted dehydrogenase